MKKSPVSRTGWHKSSYSNGGTNCVEAREHPSGSDVRDSQNPGLGHLSFDSQEWALFLGGVKNPLSK
ncbi:DUF397 domain-containing protein [Nocardiopsis exhalans]|uniref:DUF397 domain-containing protein n=1 Tax=Nocardiopsis exhalans TaxID=163604 RepID=A0ABY5D9V0_9ACTN|nr:DUF397 domain-containing protein [Nocardiopsis exhalans]USY20715.1 DUF397 domain-containing protein [Nocardiopsis exhalans]